MPRPAEAHPPQPVIPPVLQRRRRSPQRRRIPRLRQIQIQPRHQIQGQQQIIPRLPHSPRQLPQHPLRLPFLRQARLPPAIPQIHRRHRLHEHRRPAVRYIMHNPRHPRPHLGLDQQHHPPVALRNQRLLHHLRPLKPPQIPLHNFVQPMLRLPRFRPQPPQQWTGMIQHFPRRADRRPDFPLQMPQIGDVPRQTRQQRQPFLPPQRLPVIPRRPRETPNRIQLLPPQQPPQPGAMRQLANILLRPELQSPPGVNKPAGLGSFLLPGSHLQQIRRRLQRRRPFPSRRRPRITRQPRQHLVKLQHPPRLLKSPQRHWPFPPLRLTGID